MMKITEKAFAKINIGLRVLPGKINDFHHIESIFQTVNVFDELIVTENEQNETFGKISVVCDSMKLPEKNTLTLTYEAFAEVLGYKIFDSSADSSIAVKECGKGCDFENNHALKSVTVELKKNIPSGGGLGGGSSDAASLVRALEKIHGVKLSLEQKGSIASKVGSDVFFFIHGGTDEQYCAVVSGRGEKVEKFDKRNDMKVLLVFPDVFSSTKEAYSLVDVFQESGKDLYNYPKFIDYKSLYNSSFEKWSFINTFTEPLCDKYEGIGKALEILEQSGAAFSDMSGSGSTVFGIYNNYDELRNAESLLQLKGFRFAEA